MSDIPAKNRPKYRPLWDAAMNRFTREFVTDFCSADGAIDWEKLTAFGSGARALVKKVAAVKSRRQRLKRS